MRPDARLLSVELNGAFVRACRDEIADPRLILHQGCAGSLPWLVSDLNLGEIDYVVSSLPLGIMDDDLVERILAASDDYLAADGMFLQYQYSLSRRDALERRFRKVRVGFALVNIPPAFVYECSPGAPRATVG